MSTRVENCSLCEIKWGPHSGHTVDTESPEYLASLRESVDTWADAFGTWHARVNFAGGYGPQYLEGEWDRIRAKARRAIRRELISRGEASQNWRCEIEVESTDLDSLNVMHSATFCERSQS